MDVIDSPAKGTLVESQETAPKKGGRPQGSKSFSPHEVKAILDIAEESLPRRVKDWDKLAVRVGERMKTVHPNYIDRKGKDVWKKFSRILNMDAEVASEETVRAKSIDKKIVLVGRSGSMGGEQPSDATTDPILSRSPISPDPTDSEEPECKRGSPY